MERLDEKLLRLERGHEVMGDGLQCNSEQHVSAVGVSLVGEEEASVSRSFTIC